MLTPALSALLPGLWSMLLVAGAAAQEPVAPAEAEQPQRLIGLPAREQIIWLGAEDRDFPTLFLAIAPQEQPARAVLLLHDLEAQADDPYLFQPLRRSLAVRGWSSLSLRLQQLRPEGREDVQAYRRLAESISKRIRIGLEFLYKRDYQVMVVGHGYGGFVATLLFTSESPPASAGLILINPDWHSYPEGQRTQMLALRSLRIPVLDVYSEHGRGVVTSTAQQRYNALLGSGVALSRQVKIPYVGHNMGGMSEPLARILANWMRQVLSAPSPPVEQGSLPVEVGD